MSSRITMLGPDLDAQVGHLRDIVSQMIDISIALDTQGTLPPTFTKLTPNVNGDGECWFHPTSGLYVMRIDHRPVLLTTERCGTCGQAHLDVMHLFLFMSPADFDARVYSRYTSAHVEPQQPASNSGGA